MRAPENREDARYMTRWAAKAVAAVCDRRKSEVPAHIERRYRIQANDVLVCSTGRIGVPMPMKNVERGIRECVPLLARSARSARQVGEAIMTTDRRRQKIAIELKIDNRPSGLDSTIIFLATASQSSNGPIAFPI